MYGTWQPAVGRRGWYSSVYIRKKIKHFWLTEDFGTFPRNVMFFVAFSLAIRILCLGAMINQICFYIRTTWTTKLRNASNRATCIRAASPVDFCNMRRRVAATCAVYAALTREYGKSDGKRPITPRVVVNCQHVSTTNIKNVYVRDIFMNISDDSLSFFDLS